MKKYETITVQPQEHKYLIEVQCDLCKKTSKNEWKKSNSDATEVNVSLKSGEVYPYCGRGEEITIDICPDCFNSKLIPWVKSQGGEPTVKDWDF